MGYYVDMTEAEWELPEDPALLQILKEMPVKYKSIQSGGSWGPNGQEEKWFSWTNDKEFEVATSCKSIAETFCFDTRTITEDKFELSSYNTKNGQQELFLAVTAPWVTEGSYTQWRGEDGEEWRWVAKNGKLHYQEAEVRWKTPKPYAYYHYGSIKGLDTFMGYSALIDVYADDIAEQVAQAEAKAMKKAESKV